MLFYNDTEIDSDINKYWILDEISNCSNVTEVEDVKIVKTHDKVNIQNKERNYKFNRTKCLLKNNKNNEDFLINNKFFKNKIENYDKNINKRKRKNKYLIYY